MTNWREQKRKALGDVHRQFQIPAVYLTHSEGVPVPVRVRLHRKPSQSQPIQTDDWGNGASNVDLSDRIIFEAASVDGEVLHSAHVIFSRTEGYDTGPSEPERDGFITVEVTPMSSSEITALLNSVDLSHPAWSDIL